VYTALERGAIDGSLTSLEAHYSHSMDAVSGYFLFNKKQWQPQPILITVNLEAWERIPKEDREKILAVGKRANLLESRLAPDFWELCINEMKLRSKAKFVKMSDKELEMWANLPEVKGLSQKWVAEAKAAGLPAEDILKQVKKTIDTGISKETNTQSTTPH
jgi:TRAP-type C4-dicarboxylate transport system substrate-binding protein